MFCLIFAVRYYKISFCRYGNGHYQGASYSVELFKILELSGAPSDKPRMIVGVPVLLIRNLDIPRLRNGTRLKITHLGTNVVKATVITDIGRRESVLIPLLPIIPKDLSSQLKR
ncbi:hypothetical protein AVEN_204483-1 [Araneus ventricosus]|uniref:DNA helicase Pif1-like 2B domain-containing protein n=1 Tax=Araneus ventricosus TaxID=182803 RepID=A0A4Y2R472_ARAVE|nr:hypothetical protein AVEN_222495-1 [Araneus ventricosus]GBN70248.1 hypothetical protein AVEN_199608-1 [Araneus ventricosus]GBO39273.1 hypothetical protein AVEN_127319-1 [Araneus ventricosus]GBO39274.1 hypothetical protein AVEN_204483-1 [Araneus ventricosus]